LAQQSLVVNKNASPYQDKGLSHIRVITRRSPLALVQTQWVVTQLKRHHPHLHIEILPTDTEGDKQLSIPLTKVGGKGLFTKSLEDALLSGSADLAVHSLKDMPAELPKGLIIAAIPPRADPHDAFVSLAYPTWQALPAGAVVGTSSLRRQAQICRLRPDITTRFLRGNVDTRLQKLANQEYDAILLAVAGLVRLSRAESITTAFTVQEMLPAVGQGALALECRAEDLPLQALLKSLHDAKSAVETQAERQMNACLGGNCHTPIAGFAVMQGDRLHLRGLVASPRGEEIITAEHTLPAAKAVQLGTVVAERLLAQGAVRLLH
jgi:hydroxymethylbilane synthase